jgi:hypothetical protein
MNFQDLLTKIKSIDEGKVVDECGGMEIMPLGGMGHEAPKQSDSVTMNVSMNGSGAGGIRDLLNVLKDIQDGPEHDAHGAGDGEYDILIGEPEESYEEDINDGGFGSATTNPDETTLNINSVLPTGDDMHSKGGEAEKVNGGGNPMGVSESLVKQLARHYQSIKEAEQFPTTQYAPIKPNFGAGPGGEKGDLAVTASRPHKAVADYQNALVQYVRIFGGLEDQQLLKQLETNIDGRFGPSTQAGMKRAQDLYWINKKKWDSATSPTGQQAKADNEKRYQELQNLSRAMDPALGYAKF